MGEHSCLPNHRTINSIMFIQASILATLVLSATSMAVENTKAASSSINCGCQCSSITFLDTAGIEQGNCKTVDGTGAQWCYVDSTLSTCQDLVPVVVPADHVHVPVVIPAAEHVHTPLLVPSAEHVHVSAPNHVHDYVGQHNTEIPQGFSAPIPKA